MPASNWSGEKLRENPKTAWNRKPSRKIELPNGRNVLGWVMAMSAGATWQATASSTGCAAPKVSAKETNGSRKKSMRSIQNGSARSAYEQALAMMKESATAGANPQRGRAAAARPVMMSTPARPAACRQAKTVSAVDWPLTLMAHAQRIDPMMRQSRKAASSARACS